MQYQFRNSLDFIFVQTIKKVKIIKKNLRKMISRRGNNFIFFYIYSYYLYLWYTSFFRTYLPSGVKQQLGGWCMCLPRTRNNTSPTPTRAGAVMTSARQPAMSRDEQYHCFLPCACRFFRQNVYPSCRSSDLPVRDGTYTAGTASNT